MKKIAITVMCSAALALGAMGCGGGGGGSGSGWDSGSESNPTASAVDASGTAVSSIAPNSPVICKASGLLQNGVYNVALTDPNGTALYSENLILVTDGSGNLPDTIIATLGNDSGNQGNAMSIELDESGNETVKVNYKAITPGTYTAYFCKSSESSCNSSTASATTTVTVSQTTPYVFSTDATGTAGIRSFLNGSGSVYASVANATAGSTIGLRVVSNSFQLFSNGDPLPTAAGDGVKTCTADASGNCGPIKLWTTASATLSGGEGAAYDVVADVGNDGTWNSSTDFMDTPGYVPGFVIQDATPPASASINKVSYNGTDNIADIACSAAGSAYCTFTDIFDNLDVYGYLNPRARSTSPHNLAYKFIILHSDSLANGDALTPIQSFGYDHTVDPLQWGCTNEGRLLLWPKATQVAGCYDVVMDVNKNLKYDSGIDIIDGYSGHCGFIIPGVSGAPTVTVDAITDGASQSVADGGTTSSSTATFTFTATLGTGASISSCQIRWASGQSSNVSTLTTTSIATGGQMTTQGINLFNGANTVLITCVDNLNQAGSASVTITSSNSATQNIHFQTSLNWQKKDDSTPFDMDLHLVEPSGTFNSGTDCYYSNCKESSGGNTTVGAFLNVDCTSQCTGPENIWIPDSNALKAGNYKVCVYPFSGEGDAVQATIYNSSGSLIDTVTRAQLNSTVGTWYVGNFNCTAGTSGTCSWSRVDTVSVGSPCQ